MLSKVKNGRQPAYAFGKNHHDCAQEPHNDMARGQRVQRLAAANADLHSLDCGVVHNVRTALC